MNLIHAVLVAATLIGCGHFKKEHEPKPSFAEKLDELRAKRDLYLSLSEKTKDEHGWLTDTKCDGLLFNSLYAFGGGDVDLFKAKDEDGKWHRHPTKDCLKSGESKSDISRDMFLGLIFVLNRNSNREALNDLIDYDEAHGGVMGDHDGSTDGKNRVTMSPTLRATIHELADKDSLARKVPMVWDNHTGYQAHLQTLHILIRGIARNGISDYDRDALKHQADRQPNNAVHQAVFHKFEDGNQQAAVDILLREDLFPADRLPGSSERCTFYLFNHDEKPIDWNACEGGLTFSGTDLIFPAAIILDESFGVNGWN